MSLLYNLSEATWKLNNQTVTTDQINADTSLINKFEDYMISIDYCLILHNQSLTGGLLGNIAPAFN